MCKAVATPLSLSGINFSLIAHVGIPSYQLPPIMQSHPGRIVGCEGSTARRLFAHADGVLDAVHRGLVAVGVLLAAGLVGQALRGTLLVVWDGVTGKEGESALCGVGVRRGR